MRMKRKLKQPLKFTFEIKCGTRSTTSYANCFSNERKKKLTTCFGLLDETLDGVRRFYEQDPEVKREFYSRDISRIVYYNTNMDLYTSPVVNWRDTLSCVLAPRPLHPLQLPSICRYMVPTTC
ncbi:hypothetical protein Ahy_B05g074050 [Arachis hypogaea]|uniref:Uncharacterized protein n=1 Tax=Arachis hypogaea TaxID=3818 RepID=A0A444YXU6_ARAHY|nr:hypothetical protein Ahy_B05g074050 [Arachis hypogaea]